MGTIGSGRLDEMGELFEDQLKTLQAQGTTRTILATLRAKKEWVLQEALRIWGRWHNRSLKELRDEGVYLFVPVIPLTRENIGDLMEMVCHGGERGIVRTEPSAFSQTEWTPGIPYYILGVEDGRTTLGMTPTDARNEIVDVKRAHPHVLAEDIALAVHTPVLNHHGLWSVGSWRRQVSGAVPFTTLDGEGRPVLNLGDKNTVSSNLGSAFCRGRH